MKATLERTPEWSRARRALSMLACALAVASCSSPPNAPFKAVEPRSAEFAQGEPWTRLEPAFVHEQGVHSPFSCGPAALCTAFAAEGGTAATAIEALGADAIAHSVANFGTRVSEAYGDRPRFAIDSGVCGEDLLAWTNDWRLELELEPRDGLYLHRTDREDPRRFCARIHRLLVDSLRNGAAPIVRLRSFAPGYQPQRSGYVWNGVGGHWVTLTGVPTTLREGAIGFTFEYADPATGRLASGYLGVEVERPFVAAKGNARDWIWLEGSPFLVATVPEQGTLGLGTQPWFVRGLVTLDYAIVAHSTVAMR